jgi:2-oxoglutarate ferredoxin oxidoreductase subunit alpha
MDYTIKIGGEAGQGIQTIGDTLARVFSRTGYHVFSHQDYESRIRGGHNFYQIRFSDKPLSASKDSVDIIVALDRDSITHHEHELKEHGRIIYDSSALKLKYDKPSFSTFHSPTSRRRAAVIGSWRTRPQRARCSACSEWSSPNSLI